jgi:hypothetical protein
MSLRSAINAHCKSCIYDPKSGLGTWRQQVEGCQIQRCALWPVRPTASKRSANGSANLAANGSEFKPGAEHGE